jgi:hypothetical protein
VALIEGVELSVLDIKLPKPGCQDDHPDDRVSSSFQLFDIDFSTLSFVVLSSLSREVPVSWTAHESRTSPLDLTVFIFLCSCIWTQDPQVSGAGDTRPTSSCSGNTGDAWPGSQGDR